MRGMGGDRLKEKRGMGGRQDESTRRNGCDLG
jgi:hypothetical protein